MAEQAHTIFTSDLVRIGRCVKDFERRQRQKSAKQAPHRQSGFRPPIVGILLDDLLSGETCELAVLENQITTETQVFTAVGEPAGGYFRLGFKSSSTATPEWTEHLDPLNDNAERVKELLEELPGLAPGDLIVSFGVVQTQDRVKHVLWRWSVTFTGRYQGVDVEMLQVDDHLSGAYVFGDATSVLEDTGRTEIVREVLGVGWPTPLRAGARALCHWVHGIGYVVGSVEARDFGHYGLE